MAKKQYSTGLSQLDQHIGGLRPRDAVLFFLTNRTLWQPVINSVCSQAASENIPIVALSPNDFTKYYFSGLKKASIFPLPHVRTKPTAVLSALKRFITLQRHHAYYILDELSQWKALLGSDALILDLFKLLATHAHKSQSVLVSAVLRTDCTLQHLAQLKDEATVCVECLMHKNDLLCFPLSLEGRYTPSSVLPLRVALDDFMGGRLAAKPSFEETPAYSATKVDELLRVEEAMKARYENIFQRAGEAMVMFTLDGGYREINPSAVALLEHSREELLVMNPVTLAGGTSRIRLLRAFVELKRKKHVSITLDIARKKGLPLPLDVRFAALGDGVILGILRDTSERLKVENLLRAQEEQYKVLVDHLAHPLLILSNNRILFANREFFSAFRYSGEDDTSSVHLKQLLTAESLKRFQRMQRDHGSSTAPFAVESTCVRKDNTVFESVLTNTPVLFQGNSCSHISFVDTTKQKEVLNALSASEETYRSAVERTLTPTAIIENGTFTYVNQSLMELFGFSSSEEILGKLYTVVQADPAVDWIREFNEKKKSAKNVVARCEFTCTRTDGSTADVEVHGIPVRDGGQRVVLFYRDRTDENRTTEELRQRSKEIELLREITSSLHTSFDLHKLLHAGMLKIMDVLSWEIGAIYLTHQKQGEMQLSFHRNLPEPLLKKLSFLPSDEGIGGFLMKTHEPRWFSLDKYPSYLPHRSLFRESGFQRVCFVPLLSRESVVGVALLASKNSNLPQEYSLNILTMLGAQFGAAIAIAKSFKELQHHVEQYENILGSVDEVLYTASNKGTMEYISPGIERLLCYVPRDFHRNPSLWLSLVHPDDKKILLERITHLEELEERSAIEYRILPKGKAVHLWVRDTITIVRDTSGTITQFSGIVTDISKYKTLLEAVSKENELSVNTLASFDEGVVVFDRQLQCTQWNKQMEHITGLQTLKAVGKPVAGLFPHWESAEATHLLHQVLAGEKVSSDEIHVRSVDKKHDRILLGKFSPLRDQEGNVHGIVGVIDDISERKKFDAEVRESEQVLRNIIDTMGDILIITDLKGTIHQVNKSFSRILGYTRTEAIGLEFPYSWLVEEEMGRFVLWISYIREQNWLHDFDMTWKTKDGRLVPMSLSTTLLRNSMGEPIAMLNIARDITDRTRLKKDLESRNKQIEVINRIVNKANETTKFDEIFSSVAEEIYEMTPANVVNVGLLNEDGESMTIYAISGRQTIRKGDIIPLSRTVSQYTIRNHQPVIITDLAANPEHRTLVSFEEGLRSQISLPIMLKGKILGTVNIGNNEPYMYTEEDVRLLMPFAHQLGTIIDRVSLFKQVTEDASYIHNLLDSIDSIVYTVDTQYRIREVNKAWYEFIRDCGLSPAQDYHGMNFFDVLPGEQLRFICENAADQLMNGSIRIFSQEYTHVFPSGDRIYQLTINPMIIEQKITGLVFTHTDITALKRSEAKLKKSNEQLLALNDISTLISTSLDLGALLEAAIPLLKTTTGADAVIVYLKEAEGDALILAKQIGFDIVRFPSILRLEPSASATGEVVKSKEGMYISECVYNNTRVTLQNREALRESNLEALAAIPLVSKANVLGALDLFYTNQHEFSPQEQQVLTLVGNQLGSAIENARLYGELRSQIGRLIALYELSQELTSTLDIDQIFMVVAQHIQTIVPFERFAINFYDATTETLNQMFRVQVVNGEQIITPTITLPVRIEKESPEWNLITTMRPYTDEGTASLSIPMLSKNAIMGIMSLRGTGGMSFSETQMRLLESVGNLAAIALEKGKLYEETLRISQEIQRRNKELDDFTYVVSHDLKEPLISVEGFSRILQADYRDSIQAEGKEYLDSIVGATTRMKGLIDDLLMLSRVSRPSEAFKHVSIKEVIEDIKTDMVFTLRQKGVSFIMPDNLPTVWGNETQLKAVFRNLIGNAVKFNNKPNPMVEIGFHIAENNSYLFSIKDNGIGIQKEFFDKIFVIFQRLHRREEYEGTGAGLAIVKKIVEIHKGNIWVESEFGKGSTFFISLPQTQQHES
jgi:PAS domain S-box-containing protein